MNRLEQAHTMANARIHHRNGATVTNVTLALNFELASTKDEAIKLCHALGLYAYGLRNDTKLKTMTDYINKENK